MKNTFQRISFFRSLSESELRSEVLVPLFEAMGFHDVIEFHGTLEFGKDIVFYEEDRFGERIYYGVSVKAKDIHGTVAKSGNASEVLIQAQQALAEPWVDPFNGKEHLIDWVIIATSGKITHVAAFGIRERMRGSHVRFLHGTKLLSLIDKYAPTLIENLAGESVDIDQEQVIQNIWLHFVSKTSAADKGKSLEQLTKLLFESIPGFVDAVTNVRSKTEELDIIVRNESIDPFWSKQGPFIIIECKNWSKQKVGRNELDSFAAKMSRKAGWCRVGFFVSISGFTRVFMDNISRYIGNNILIVPIDKVRLKQLIQSRDRRGLLKGFVLSTLNT
jgi:hypothetical protein